MRTLIITLLLAASLTTAANPQIVRCKNALNGDIAYFTGYSCPTGWYPWPVGD